MKKLVHLADVHFAKETQDLALTSLECALESGKREQIDAWVFAGDFFDRGVANSTASGFPRLVKVIQRMLDVAPILSIEGTPTHDLPGAYAVLCELKAKYPFINLRPERPEIVAGLLFMGLPEAGREWLLAGMEGVSAEETAEAMRAAMRSILLGFGAVRAEHLDLPAVLVHHGPITGSSMQNRQLVEGGLGREDLQLVDFDYAALGHIHLEQQIEGVEAYYPGPAFHTDWGHLGMCGFNLVEFMETSAGGGGVGMFNFDTIVTRIPFPHPRRCKFTVGYPEPVGAELVQGVQAWVCIKATKEQAAKIDTAAVLEAYRGQGAVEGSRVTVELLPTETVRVAEITEKHRLREKVLVYAEASSDRPDIPGVALGETILAKCEQLEREAEERGDVQATSIVLHGMKLHGAKGIYKGRRLLRRLLGLPALPLDDVEIDFDKFAPGIIGLVGETGTGKTTILSFLAPFSETPARPGPLRNYFRLRDSSWELAFSEEYTGNRYRVFVEIDGMNSSGSCNYHLFCNGEPLTNGRLADFDEKVKKLFGSPELFVRCSYVAQKTSKSNPDLADATKGERKAIFRELAGLDYIQAYADSAKARAGALEGQLSVGRGQVEVLTRFVGEEHDVMAALYASERDVKEADRKIAELTETGKGLKERVETLAALVTEQEAYGKEIHDAANQAQAKIAGAEEAREKVEKLQEALAYQPAALEQIAQHDKLKAEEAAENERLSGINKERARLLAAHTDAITAHRDHAQRLQAAKTRVATAEAARKADRRVLHTKIQHAEVELAEPLTENCPTCGQLLQEAKRTKLRQTRDAKEELLDGWEQEEIELDRELQDLARWVIEADANLIALLEPTKPALPPASELGLVEIRSLLVAIDITAARATLETAAKAEQEIATLNAQIATLDADAAALTSQVEALRAQLDPAVRTEHAEAIREYEQARADYTAAKEERATAAAKLEAAQKQLASITKQKCELEELRSSIAKVEAEAAEWRYLEQACGPDGIQALELDALGPGIAATANGLLSDVFGSRFTVEFRTTRIAGKGSKTKQVEDFAIWIIDNEDGGSEQDFFSLSGGESVPVRLAIYEAFAGVREQKFSPMILDEADGNLSPSLRINYVAMVDRAREEAKRRNTILISHDTTVQEMIVQKIDMAELAKQSPGVTSHTKLEAMA